MNVLDGLSLVLSDLPRDFHNQRDQLIPSVTSIERWETLAAHRQELQEKDIYTLRRIVPKDRGLTWGDR